MAILEADNPVQAANRHRLTQSLTAAKSRLKSAQNQVLMYSAEVEKLEASLNDMASAESRSPENQ